MRKIMIALVCVCLLSVYAFAQERPENKSKEHTWTGTTEQKIWGLMTIWSEVKFAFPYPEKLAQLHWDEAVQASIPKVIATNDIEMYYRILMELVAQLKDSHTEIVPPWGRLRAGYDIPPIEIKIIENKFFIVRTGDSDELRQHNVSPGLEILEVEHVPVRTYFEENVLKYRTRGTKHADEALLIFYMLFGPQDEKVQLTVKEFDASTREVHLSRNSMNTDGTPFVYDFIKHLMFTNTIQTSMLSGGIVYINIPHFNDEQVSVDLWTFIDQLDLSATQGMIIDLRHNLGGNDGISTNIIEGLITTTAKGPTQRRMQYSAHGKAEYHQRIAWSSYTQTITPRDGKRYTGPLVLLISPLTHSSAEDFVISLSQRQRVVTVGEKTSGGTGGGVHAALPGGGDFQVATFTATYPNGKDYVGIGIQPDIEVHPTLQDILEGHDSVLEKGIEILQNGL